MSEPPQRLSAFLPRITLRTKMLTLFLCLIAIPLSLQGMITYSRFSTSTEARTVEYTSQIVHQINQNLDRNLAEMKRLSLTPLYDNSIIAILKELRANQEASFFLSSDKRQKMFLYISSLTYSRPEVKGIQIISANGTVFSNLDPATVSSKVNLRQESWYRRVIKGNGAAVIIPQHHPGYYLDTDQQPYFAVARLLREPNTNEPLGIMKIDLKMDMIEQLFVNMPFTKEGSVLIVNKQSELFYEKQNRDGTPGYRSLLRETEWLYSRDTQPLEYHGQQYLQIDHESDATGLKVISIIPRELLLQESKDLRDFTVLIAAIFLFGAGGLAVYFAYSLSKPLVRLKEKMSQVEKGNLHERVPVASRDEIGMLGEQFNRMVGEMNRLVNEVYMISLREREAELAALQSQINPHFIYNTLEAINMMAIKAGNFDVSDMVSSLGKLMRYTVDRSDGFVKLADEIESLRSYIRIQQTRLGERLHVEMAVDEELVGAYIPKLLLQPLIENAIYHGIENLEAGGTIWLAVTRHEQELRITVKDDGKGLDDHELARLRRLIHIPFHQLEEERNGRNGTALRNINQRITLLYGEAYGLEVNGSPGRGAQFSLSIPITQGGRGYVQSAAGGR
ncbi:cache domain-containing sensor histidine kinase [Brevibacillus migulae]|uniref:cache domain-containing sensor histidine kinase n=1 Tax=Brevibacillus migulae TaxID=1644114 RepID=UPI001F3A778C|nr:sensor histidine kinase [Brevibacillus migulae]